MMVRRIGILLLLLWVVGCKSTPLAGDPPADEARSFMRKLRTIALADPEQRLTLLSLACADINSCSAECSQAFRDFSTLSEHDRGEPMLKCGEFAIYAKDADVMQLRERSRDWVHLELRSYALRVERSLGKEGQRALETLDRAIAGQPPYWEE